VVPRTSLKDLKNNKDSENPAVYFLFGEDKETEEIRLYIGETENFINRLVTHDQTKDFWDIVIGFMGSLDKAKVKYLEHLANLEARKVGRFISENSVSPKKPHLSDFDEISVLDYFNKMKYILSALGFPVFDEIPKEKQLELDHLYYLEDVNNKDAFGKGTPLASGEFVVFKESKSRIKETPSFKGSGLRLRNKLIEEGVLKIFDDKSYTFTRDYIFKTPSAAGDAVMGRSTNGWTGWKDEKGNSLDENLRKFVSM
jgi:hypothetical protein